MLILQQQIKLTGCVCVCICACVFIEIGWLSVYDFIEQRHAIPRYGLTTRVTQCLEQMTDSNIEKVMYFAIVPIKSAFVINMDNESNLSDVQKYFRKDY